MGPCWITALRQRSESARHIYDVRGWRLAQQREHCLSNCHAAQKVYAEVPLYCIEAAARRQTVTLRGDAGIVDENVEMSEILLDLPRGGSHAGGIIKVDGEKSN